MEFKAFPKIEQFGKVFMTITQKINGTNAQVYIEEVEDTDDSPYLTHLKLLGEEQIIEVENKSYLLKVGSRTRWITPDNDNFGFATFVYANKEEFVRKLGVGQHFGEWAGPGINSGEGLTEKTFFLFDEWKFPPERELPPQTKVVPVLYKGKMDLAKVAEAMEDLKTNGSKIAPGFMRPEGVVINAMGSRFKKVFEDEETQWSRTTDKDKINKAEMSAKTLEKYGHLLQPIRVEKLLSRDEKYLLEYPKNTRDLMDLYVQDLVDEKQIDETLVKSFKKEAGTEINKFIRSIINK